MHQLTTIGYSNDMFSVEEEDALDAGAYNRNRTRTYVFYSS